jgi:methylated-DNA-[protein]-cysteine S-methyltransferase
MPEATKFHVSETDLGWVAVVTSGAGIRSISLPLKTREEALEEAARNGADEPVDERQARVLDAAMRSLVAGRPLKDPLNIDWRGITPFRRQVLEECASIPAGETRTYAWLAEQAGRPRAARAAGRVMATNPWPLLIPCHRVLGSDGSLHGYGGGLAMKEALLRAEGAQIPG